MWGLLISAVAIVLLGAGGLPILQTMTLIASLPFAVLMIFMMVSLWKALNNDAKYFATAVNPGSIFWSGDHWRERLGQMMNQTQEVDIIKFMKNTALPRGERPHHLPLRPRRCALRRRLPRADGPCPCAPCGRDPALRLLLSAAP